MANDSKEVVQPVSEAWSWAKFFKGFFDGRNYAKAIVIGVCQAVLVGLLVCVYLAISNYLGKHTPVPDSSVLSGQTITQNIDKSEKQVSQTYLPFSGGLLSFGSHGKTQNKE